METKAIRGDICIFREMPSGFRSSGCTCTNEIAILNRQSRLVSNASRPRVVSCVRQHNPESEHPPAGLEDPALVLMTAMFAARMDRYELAARRTGGAFLEIQPLALTSPGYRLLRHVCLTAKTAFRNVGIL
jgi:hypothetical protein